MATLTAAYATEKHPWKLARLGRVMFGLRTAPGAWAARRHAVSDNDIELGPVDYLIVERPAGKEPTGEGLDLLVGLTERGLIRVIDLAFVMKEEDGTVKGLAIADIDSDGSLDLRPIRGRVLGSPEPRGLQRGGRGPRARHLGGDSRLREQVGRAVRHCPQEERLATSRQRADPGQRAPGEARRARGRAGLANTTGKEGRRCQDFSAELLGRR
jgi:hypothetical protein